MGWLKIINNELFKEWLVETGSDTRLPQGNFRLDPFGSSLRKFNNAHTWLAEFDETGAFNPTGRKSQALTDLSSAEIFQPDETFSELGKTVFDDWQSHSIPPGDNAYEVPRCLILIEHATQIPESIYNTYLERWINLRSFFTFNFLIQNKVYLFLFSYLDKTVNGFNPFEFIKNLSLKEEEFDTDVDWQHLKDYYNQAEVSSAVDKYRTTIEGYLTREGRSNLCIAMELFRSGSDVRQEILNSIDLPDEVKLIIQNILPEISPINKPEQIIYFGAPGTGKSHTVNELITGKPDQIERITFHPEFDYTSFVGGYKPIMDGKDIRYEFVPQAFTHIYVNAWKRPFLQYYLVIEEINRGNCAEIFGDIFQLLDRKNNYSISASKELKEFLERSEILGKNHAGIRNGKLLLPPNLNILATMNTSDQSLFPMDSAFKRRWDWQYVPINYEEEGNRSAKFEVKITEGNSFSWIRFIGEVNKIIKDNENLGMDKCIGNYFINPEKETITLEEFVNKAIFYLWNDVFKDELEEKSIFKKDITYEDFFPIQTEGVKQVEALVKFLGIQNPA